MDLDEETAAILGFARPDPFDFAAWCGGIVARMNAYQRERYRRIKRWVWRKSPSGPIRVRHHVQDRPTRCSRCRSLGHNVRTCLR